MTKSKNQRQKIIILEFLDTMEDYHIDKYGNYLKYLSEDIRYKPKKNVLRKERKIFNRWSSVWSVYYKNISIVDNKMAVGKSI